MSLLEAHDICSAYGPARVVDGVSLQVGQGRITAVLGRNGMGKTSLIRSIMGLAPPRLTSGKLSYKGTDIASLAPFQIAQLGVGYVPQGRHIFRSLTVREHLTTVARAPRDGQQPWTVARVYGLFPRLAERERNRGGQLSGGEQQMLAIGRAIMTNPDLLIMDEPSEGLAPLLIQELGTQLLSLKGSGLSILLVEQNLQLALRLADDVHVIERGQIVYSGLPGELQLNEDVKRRYLGVG